MKILFLLCIISCVCWQCSESPPTLYSSIQKEEKIEIYFDYAKDSGTWDKIIILDSEMVVRKREKEVFFKLSQKQLDSTATLTERFHQASYQENTSVYLQEYRYTKNDSPQNVLSVPLKEGTILHIPDQERILDRISISRHYNGFEWTMSYIYTPQLQQHKELKQLLWYLDSIVK